MTSGVFSRRTIYFQINRRRNLIRNYVARNWQLLFDFFVNYSRAVLLSIGRREIHDSPFPSSGGHEGFRQIIKRVLLLCIQKCITYAWMHFLLGTISYFGLLKSVAAWKWLKTSAVESLAYRGTQRYHVHMLYIQSHSSAKSQSFSDIYCFPISQRCI